MACPQALEQPRRQDKKRRNPDPWNAQPQLPPAYLSSRRSGVIELAGCVARASPPAGTAAAQEEPAEADTTPGTTANKKGLGPLPTLGRERAR